MKNSNFPLLTQLKLLSSLSNSIHCPVYHPFIASSNLIRAVKSRKARKKRLVFFCENEEITTKNYAMLPFSASASVT